MQKVCVSGRIGVGNLGLSPHALPQPTTTFAAIRWSLVRFRVAGLASACAANRALLRSKRHRGGSNPCGQSPMDFLSRRARVVVVLCGLEPQTLRLLAVGYLGPVLLLGAPFLETSLLLSGRLYA